MTWSALIRWYFAQKIYWLCGLLAVIIVAAVLEVLFPWLVQEAVDAAVGSPSEVSFGVAIAGMGALAVGAAVLHGVGIWIDARLFSAASSELRRRLVSSFLSRPLSYIHERHSSELIHRVSSSVSTLEQLMIELFSEMPFSVIVAVGIIIMMGRIDLWLTALVLGQLVLAAYLTHRISARLPAMQRLLQLLGARLSGQLQETITAIRVVKAFGAERQQFEKMEVINQRFTDASVVAGNMRSLVVPIWGMVEVLSVVFVLWFGGDLLLRHKISIGQLVAFITYVEMLAVPVHRFGDYYFLFQACRGTSQRIASALRQEKSEVESTTGTKHVDEWQIEFDNVVFRYSSGLPPVLNGVSFRVALGESLAIVGRNGAGKSTLLDLMLRFHEPDNGQIRVGSSDLNDWDVAAWRRTIGFVPQENQLLSGTLEENLSLGMDHPDVREIESVFQRIVGEDWQDRFPQGIKTVVGEGGLGLSGGQRQLIAIARVLLRDPPIVILDEPTAHLDGETLERVNSAISQLMENRIVLLVSHQSETIRLASRVIVLDGGQVVESGSPHSLLKSSTRCLQLVTANDE